MKYMLLVVLSICALSCENVTHSLKTGVWRSSLIVQEGQELPFNFEVEEDGTLTIFNAEERITVDEISITGDSINIQTPVFEGFFTGRFTTDERIEGTFIKPSLDRVVPFVMEYGISERFISSNFNCSENSNFRESAKNITGSYETVFSPDSPDERYIAKGIFKQEGEKVTGTFRTTTGDYRYLEGAIKGNELRLSTFDGAHAFLFTATATDSTLTGYFYSGNHWKEPFRAVRNETYELPDANGLTYLKEGYDTFTYGFPNAAGQIISLEDEQFKDKVVITTLMGTWCPNCLEESKFLTDYLREHPSPDLKVVSLAFEYAKTEEDAFKAIKRLQERLKIPYPILLAQYGSSDKKEAQEKLPMLNHILSYPTMIVTDKTGKVRRIHTGYNGTATGTKYSEFKQEFEEFVSELITE